MKTGLGFLLRPTIWLICWLVLCSMFPNVSFPQDDEGMIRQGHPIGKVTTQGNLIVMELDDGALGKTNLFDLVGRTLRFIPEGSPYHIESGNLQWDSDFGSEVAGSEVTLHQFAFPFSGRRWTAFHVGRTGSIRFGEAARGSASGPNGPIDGGVSIGRFEPLQEAAGRLIDSALAICVFLKPRMSGPHYVKELADRVVITWDLTEPFGNIQDFTWFKTVNRFQAVLHQDGSIQMSYKELAAKDAIVGVYPVLAGTEKSLIALRAEPHSSLPEHVDVRTVKVAIIDGVLLRVTFETRGPVLSEGDAGIDGLTYRVRFEPHKPSSANPEEAQRTVWAVRGVRWPPRRPSRYVAFGPGVSRRVKASGNTITVEGVLPESVNNAREVSISAEVAMGANPGPVERIAPRPVRLTGTANPALHFSSLTPKDGPFAIAYESFHYLSLPRPQDLSCTVIKALGDRLDFLAYYSDFRIDNQEAGTPSDGPKGGNVLGTGENHHDLDAYCTEGRFQWGYVQPVHVGSNQMQEWPPEGAPVGGDHDITFYAHQLEESAPDRKMLPYNYAISQLGHEMGHRWAAFVSAKVNGDMIQLGPVHWARGLQAPVTFPYQRPVEASTMGGGVWQDNLDGTYTQLDDDYYVPASGYSYLDLYLMGMISAAEVPDFFILQNLVSTGKDGNGRPIFKAERTKITISRRDRSGGTPRSRCRSLATEFQYRDRRRARTRACAEPRSLRTGGCDSPTLDRLLAQDYWSPGDDDYESALNRSIGFPHIFSIDHSPVTSNGLGCENFA